MTDENKTKETETKEKKFMDGWVLSEREQMIKEWYYKRGYEEGSRKKEYPWYCWLIVIIIIIVIGFLAFGSYGCAKVNVAETTPEFAGPQTAVSVVQPKVKVWPEYIEIKAEVKDADNATYRVSYQYFKKITESGVEAKLSLEPTDSKDKLPSEIYISKSGKIVKVRIWSVGDYDCPSDYAKMCGSVCQAGEDKYKFFCAPERMNCKAIVEEVLLKEPAEWL